MFVSWLVHASPLPGPVPGSPLTEGTCGANLSLSEPHSRGQQSATNLDPPTSPWLPHCPPSPPSLIPSSTIAHMQNVSLCPGAALIWPKSSIVPLLLINCDSSNLEEGGSLWLHRNTSGHSGALVLHVRITTERREKKEPDKIH